MPPLPEPYLSIRADGTAVFGNPRGNSRRPRRRALSDRELQDLLRFVVRDNGFFALDGNRLDAALRGRWQFRLSRRDHRPRPKVQEHEVRCQGVSESLVQRLSEIKGVRQLGAVQQRLERVMTWLHAGGK